MWRHQADNLSMRSGLGEHIPIAVQHVTQVHTIPVRETARTYDVAFQIDGTLAVRKNWFDTDSVSVLHLKGSNDVPIGLRAWLTINVRRRCYRLAMTVGVNALDSDMAE